MEEIEHEHTDEIVCPYCGDKQADSWELDSSGKEICDECGNEFEYDRNTEVTYTTYKTIE